MSTRRCAPPRLGGRTSARALQTAQAAEPARRIDVLSALATTLAETGEHATAHQALQHALATVQSLAPPQPRTSELASQLRPIVAALEHIEGREGRTPVLQGIADMLVQGGDIATALETVQGLQRLEDRALVLQGMALSLVRAGTKPATR